MLDKFLEGKIKSLQDIILTWANNHQLWYDSKFWSYDEYFDDKPQKHPIVLVLTSEGGMHNVFNPLYADGETSKWIALREEFSQLIQTTEFFWEMWDYTTAIFTARETDLDIQYSNYYNFQWTSKLIAPDFSDIYQEVFTFFANHPENLKQLHHRKFEEFLEAIFRNHGYTTFLGSGIGDGGIDLRLVQHDVIGEIVTLVQAKRYTKEPISLETVSALMGVLDDAKANRGLLVTTSRFLPSAKEFAERQNKKIQLATSDDVVNWCKVIEHRQQTVIMHDILKLNEYLVFDNDGDKIEKDRIVYSTWGYNMTINQFCLIIKETQGAVLMVELETKVINSDGYNQSGYEIPIIPKILDKSVLNSKRLIRAIKKDGYYRGDLKNFRFWDGTPVYFNTMD